MAHLSPELKELFSERFPRYALLLNQWKQTECEADREPEEITFSSQTEVLYLYGLSERLSREIWDWLGGMPARRLIFLEPSTSRIVRFLEKPFAREILECRQIEIVLIPAGRGVGDVLQECAELYPFRGVQVRSFVCADQRKFARVRLLLLRKTALAHAHHLERLHGHIPFSHLIKNLNRIADAFYANGLKNAFQGVPAVICGAGPSLSSSLEILRTLERRALIFAGGSAIAVLSHHGITPHFCMAIDPNRDEFLRLKNSFAFEVPFLFSSRLFPESFATCNGPFGYLRSGMAGVPELWFEEQLGLRDPILGEKLSPEALSVTALSSAFAHHLGCNPILFDGIDLAYTENRRYADGVFAEEESNGEEIQPIDRVLSKRSRQGKAVRSAVRWVMEAAALSRFAQRTKERRWINCTRGGIGLKGVETASLEEVAFDREWDLREMIHVAILRAPMPTHAKELLQEKKTELCRSLEKVLAHLKVLVEGKKSGLCVLAELEMREELAYAILLFDAEKTIRTTLGPVEGESLWSALLEIADRYHSVFRDSAPYS